MHVVSEKQLQIHPSTVTVQQPIDCKFYICTYIEIQTFNVITILQNVTE